MFDINDLNKYCEIKFPKLKVKKYDGNLFLITGPPNSGKTSFILDLYKKFENYDNSGLMIQSIIDIDSLITAEIAERMISEINIDEDDIFCESKLEDVSKLIIGFGEAYRANVVYIDSLDRITTTCDFTHTIYDINIINNLLEIVKNYNEKMVIVATMGIFR